MKGNLNRLREELELCRQDATTSEQVVIELRLRIPLYTSTAEKIQAIGSIWHSARGSRTGLILG
jgi:hypothetical protein